MKNFLTEKDREVLKELHKQEKNRRDADRIKAVLLSDTGWTYKKIAEALLLDEETVSKHINEYRDSRKLSNACKGYAGLLDRKETLELVAVLQECTFTRAVDVCAHVKRTYGKKYSVAGMTEWLHRNGFSYKKPTGFPAKINLEDQEQFAERYYELRDSLPADEPLEFCDAVHPTMATKLSYGWIKTGLRKMIKTTASRTRINILGSINLKTMKLTTTSHETINSSAMIILFDKLKEKYPDAPKIHLVLDRGPYNTSEETKTAASVRGIELHHLPPYSPNLNPIERVWKVMNEYVRNNRFFSSPAHFKEQIDAFFNSTWKSISEDMRSRVNDTFQLFKSSV